MKPSRSIFARIRADGQTYNSYSRSVNAAQPIEPIQAHHGNQIFIYRNIRTNQIVYSLTRSLNVPSPFPPPSSFPPPLAPANRSHSRTTPPSNNSPSSAKKPSPPPSAKTSGSPSPSSNSPPPSKASTPTANCVNSGDCTRHPTTLPSSPSLPARTKAGCSTRSKEARS